MTIVNFTPWTALGGGLLIGLSAAIMLLLAGRIAGISGILAGLLPPVPGDATWRVWFLGGLILGSAVWRFAGGAAADAIVFEATYPAIIVGGLLTGVGTRVSGGCTSGHGVCGIGRFSPRSMAATCIFMATGAITVYVSRHVVGA